MFAVSFQTPFILFHIVDRPKEKKKKKHVQFFGLCSPKCSRLTSADITILTAHLQAGQNGQSVLLPGIGLTFAVSREMSPERSG